MAAILERMERQSEEDRRERKAESALMNKALAHDRNNAEMTRSAVSAALADIVHGQADMVKRLDKIEPITDLVTSVRSRVTGGVILLGFLGGIAWAGVLFFKETIQGWFS